MAGRQNRGSHACALTPYSLLLTHGKQQVAQSSTETQLRVACEGYTTQVMVCGGPLPGARHVRAAAGRPSVAATATHILTTSERAARQISSDGGSRAQAAPHNAKRHREYRRAYAGKTDSRAPHGRFAKRVLVVCTHPVPQHASCVGSSATPTAALLHAGRRPDHRRPATSPPHTRRVAAAPPLEKKV